MRPTKTTHIFQVYNQQVKFSGNFDSGNLRTVIQTAHQQFLIQSSLDSYEIQVSKKSFFHFSVQNYPIQKQLTLMIPNIALLGCIKKKQNLYKYRPFFSTNGLDYERLDINQCSVVQSNKQEELPGLRIKILIQKQSLYYFSFALPYSYEKYLNFVRDLPYSTEYYLRKEVLCYSTNLHLVFALTITSNDRLLQNPSEQEISMEPKATQIMFPQRSLEKPQERQKIFDKPVILLSGRVHPGQTPSSWAIQGIIKFLLSNQKLAILLRKNFQIVIVPMLNPDGAYEGYYRLDTKGHNLNRYYLISDNRQPTIYCMKKLISHYSSNRRLLYYFDFHGHPSFKGSFLYGNAIEDIVYQTQAELFARLLANRCQTFQQKYCIFDRQQMKTKHKLDVYTKEGCARVYAFNTGNVIHSYTVQMGFHSTSKGTVQSLVQNKKDETQTAQFWYDKQNYYKQGVDIMKCIAQSPIFNIKSNQASSNLHQLRKTVASEIYNREDRFKLQQKNIYNKIKSINELIESQYWQPILKRFYCAIKRIKKNYSLSSNSNSPNRKYNNEESLALNQCTKDTQQKIKNWINVKSKPVFLLKKIQFQEQNLQNYQQNILNNNKNSLKSRNFALKKYSSLHQSIEDVQSNLLLDQNEGQQSPKISQKSFNSINFNKYQKKSKDHDFFGRVSLQKIKTRNIKTKPYILKTLDVLNNRKVNFYKKNPEKVQENIIENYQTENTEKKIGLKTLDYLDKKSPSKLTGFALTPLQQGLLSPRARMQQQDDTQIFNDMKIRPNTIDVYSGKFCVIAQSKLGNNKKMAEFKDVFQLNQKVNSNVQALSSNVQKKLFLNDQKYQSQQLQINRHPPCRQKYQNIPTFSRKHRRNDRAALNLLRIKGLQ